MIPIPLILYGLGILLGEMYQWGNWIPRNSGKPWRGYWATGMPHLMANAVVIVGVAALWATGLLDDAIDKLIPSALAGDWADVGVPYTPQCGVLLGAAADITGDQIAYLVRLLLGKRFPSFAPVPAPAAPPTPEVKP